MRPADAPGLSALFAEAERQLNICNACRFCEGYCAVFPALERRAALEPADMSYLANLCHDCRACVVACMYAAPHEFALDPPALFARLRRADYRAFTPAFYLRRPAGLRSRRATAAAALACAAGASAGFVVADHGFAALYRATEPAGSPYGVMAYAAIVAASAVVSALAVAAMATGAWSWWRAIGRRPRELADLSAWRSAARRAATLRHLRGGAEGCYLVEDRPSALRRWAHHLVAYGFVACLAATVAAGIAQDLLGRHPPFALWSFPVVSGLLGGSGLVVGTLALTVAHRHGTETGRDPEMATMDRVFVAALFALGASGLATLACRGLPVYGVVLAIHLAIVWSAILLAPTGKFVHLVYRLLALVADELEGRAGA